jgi:hypothetical protein
MQRKKESERVATKLQYGTQHRRTGRTRNKRNEEIAITLGLPYDS